MEFSDLPISPTVGLLANTFPICILFHCILSFLSDKDNSNLHPVSLYLTISGYTQRLSFVRGWCSFVLVFEATLDQILYWPHHTLIFA
jgi:hypothetical protein